MASGVKTSASAVIPALRYRNALAAIEWLCRNFGFEKHLVVLDDDGRTVHHAQLILGSGMVMLGSVDKPDSEYGRYIRQPDEVGGFETQSAYVVVADADAVYRNVKADGGQVVIEIKDNDFGGRGFTCRDLEGRLWSVGTYDPWAEPAS